MSGWPTTMIVWFGISLASYNSSSSCGRKPACVIMASGECSSNTSERSELDARVNEGMELELRAKSAIKNSVEGG